MTADELAYRAAMNDLGLNAMMNIDEMMRNVMGLKAFESMQNINDIVEKTANHSALEPMQSALEKIEAMQTTLERAMNPPSLEAARTLERAVNSPVFEAMRSEDRIFAGVTGGFLDDGSKFTTGLEEMKGIASLKDGSNKSLFAGLAAESHVGEAFAASSINNSVGRLIGSSFGDDFKKTSFGLAVASLEENAKQLGFAQGMSPIGVSFGASSINDAAKGLIGSFFEDDFKKTYLGSSLEESSKKWADAVPKIVEIKPLPEPMLIMPEIIEFEPPDLSLITPISREVTLSDETIEKLAEKLAEKGSKVIVIAKNKGVAIMGNASSDMINTGYIISDKRAE